MDHSSKLSQKSKLKDLLIQQSFDRRLKQPLSNALAQKNTGSTIASEHPSRGTGVVPEDFYRFDRMPAFRQVQIIARGAQNLKINNPFFKPHEGIAGAHTRIEGKPFINFASYNYLNYSGDPDINRAAIAAIEQYGTSVSASRLVSGERPIHRELEQALAQLYDTEDALVFVSGHATNVSTIGCLFGPRDLIVHDEYIHNSVMLGIQLSGAKRLSIPHNDFASLDRLLTLQRSSFERVLVVIEGLYSMDGDFPDLPRFVELRNRHRVFLMVDEAHSMGVMGPQGHGIREHFKLASNAVDIWMGTLSKTFASCGGYVAGDSALIEQLKYAAAGSLYSVGLAPPLAAAALAALQGLRQDTVRVHKLQRNGQFFLEQLKAAGVNTGTSAGLAIVPAMVGGSVKAARLSSALFERGINAPPIMYPAVPEKSARLRFFISSEHTIDELALTASILSDELTRIE